MNESEAKDIRERALAVSNPPDATWQDFLTARFMGRVPDNICEVPTMLVIEPTTYTPQPDTDAIVSGFFEHSTDPHSANLGGFDGTLNPTTQQFTFRDRSPSDAWTFSGHVSPNGRVFDLSIVFEDGFTSDTFSLIHEDSFGELMPQ